MSDVEGERVNAGDAPSPSSAPARIPMPRSLEERFHAAMLHVYYACAAKLKPPFFASRFRDLVHEVGGRQAADELLAATAPSAVFLELCLRGSEHLTLSVEYLVLQAPWRALFSPEQRATARDRLRSAGGALPPDDEVGIEA